MKIAPDAAAERAVLAGIVKYGKNCLAEVQELLNVDSFDDLSNKVVYKCLCYTLENMSIVDYPSLLSSASEIGLYEAITTKEQTHFIQSLFAFPIREENVMQHAAKLKKLQIRREMAYQFEAGLYALQNMTGQETIAEILSVENQVLDYTASLSSNDDTKPVKIFDGVLEHLEYIADNPSEIVGIATGYSIYDRVLGGGQRKGAVNLIVARTGVGKTMHAKSVCMHVAGKLNIPVLMIDSEMDKMDQVNRAIADANTVHINDVETGKFGKLKEREQVFKFVKENVDIPYYHKSTPMMMFEEVKAMIRRWLLVEVGVDEDGNRRPCLVVYDYFKVMNQRDAAGMSEFQLLGFQMDEISQVCKKYGASCLSYVQANRDGISDEDLSIIAQSDRLSWFASSVCLLKEKTSEEIQAEVPQGIPGNAKLIVLKSRYGPKYLRDYIDMNKQGEYGRISEIGLQSELKARFLGDDTEQEDVDDEEQTPWDD